MVKSVSPWKIGSPFSLSGLLALSILSFCTLGYHPDAEDGGVYAAAIQQRVSPWLFPHDHAFVAAHVGNGVFAWLLSGLVVVTHLSVPSCLAILQFATILTTLWGSYEVAKVCFHSELARFGAVIVTAFSLSLPVAGTALYLTDPYCSARSISLPLLLFALQYLLRHRIFFSVLLLAAAFVLHPIMGLWGGLFLVSVWTFQRSRPMLAFASFSVAALSICLVGYLLSPVDDGSFRVLAATRSYWFLGQWQWYEMLGAFAPPALLLWRLSYHERAEKAGAEQRILVFAHAAATSLSLLIALLFARSSAKHLFIARIQPLRTLHLLYAVFLIVVGGRIGNYLHEKMNSRKGERVALAVLAGCIATPLFVAQLEIYPASQHLELPWRQPANGWSRAFVWCREHTSQDDLFALDAHYITVEGEDAQNFRSIALRSSLPDYSKDGGVASVSPSLAADWLVGVAAQSDLNQKSDAERLAQLVPLHVDWIVLPEASATSFPCDYRNDVAKVCRLPGGTR